MEAVGFIPASQQEVITDKTVTWSAPSNIALVKYWGKYDPQIPANPSLSFTLNNCKTKTSVALAHKNRGSNKSAQEFSFEFSFEHYFLFLDMLSINVGHVDNLHEMYCYLFFYTNHCILLINWINWISWINWMIKKFENRRSYLLYTTYTLLVNSSMRDIDCLIEMVCFSYSVSTYVRGSWIS